MNQERHRVLSMLAEGKISVEEAERLLTALAEEAEPSAGAETAGRARPKYLRVLVDDNSEDGSPTKVNIRVPLKLIRAGIKLKGVMPDEARDKANAALARKGIRLDVDNIGADNIDELIDALSEMTVDVEDGAEKVRIFCE